MSKAEIRMTARQAIAALGALAQETRLAIFRLLVERGPEGLPAGAIAELLGVPDSSLSFHLAQLSRAGLLSQHRQGRSLIYAVDFGGMNELMGYLTENCCGGSGAAACLPTKGVGCTPNPAAPPADPRRKSA
jgi:ArsR family transcriptional regulator, arsenate/arsenite/antimonite-responsive transcriptional repressor